MSKNINNLKSNLNPLSYVTEKEKIDLFQKLEKIANQLFGIDISIKEKNKNDGTTSCTINKKRINLCLEGIDYSEDIEETIRKNIDSFDYVTPNKLKEIPILLTTFFHELSHILTVNSDHEYLEKYFIWKGKYGNTNDAHRRYPYEKLADNLSYNLVAKNYDIIVKILLDKHVIITQNIKKENLDLVKKYKEKYITIDAFNN
jgi:hypothetical protein